MASLLENGPKLDWTRDHQLYERFLKWKDRCQLAFNSALKKNDEPEKCNYLKYWMGNEGLPYIKKWEATRKLDYTYERPVPAVEVEGVETEPAHDISSGHKLATYWTLLEELFKPKANKIISIIDLWTKFKQNSQGLTEWITKVYNMVEDCDYGDSKNRIIRDILITGNNNPTARDKIIREGTEVTLDKVIEILEVEESTTRTLQHIDGETRKVHYVKYDKKKSGSKGGKKIHSTPQKSNSNGSQQPSGNTCYRCKAPYTKGHEKVCKALKAKCNFCEEIGHYSKCCKKAGNFPKKKRPTFKKKVHLAEAIPGEEYYDEDGNPKRIAPVQMLRSSNSTGKKDLLIQFGISKNIHSIDQKVILKVDTGSDVNAINQRTFKQLFPDVELGPSKVILQNFDNTYIQPLGSFKCFLRWKSKKYRIDMEVMGSDSTPNVLSRETTFIMKILKPCFVLKKEPAPEKEVSTSQEDAKDNSSSVPVVKGTPRNKPTSSKQQEKAAASNSTTPRTSINPDTVRSQPLTKEMVTGIYSDVFEGLGKFPGPPYKFRIKEDAVPAKHRTRKVPVHLQEAFHEEIKRLVKIDVLEPVKEQTEWVNSFVIVEKDVVLDSSNPHSPHHSIKKKLRVCLDPKDLNEALEREPYYSRSVDELIAKFTDATIFTIVDMDKGYWQVELDASCRKYTCMALDIGRFQWKRLPMGTVVASDIFQKKLDAIYIGLPGVTGIADDMIVYGRTEEEHDRNLIRFLETTRRNGLKLNKSKLQFKRRQVSFFGHIWSQEGISPDPAKINSILNMDFPADKETMQSFLGLVNFLNRYSPRLAELCEPLRRLIVKDVHYKITEEMKTAFHRIKEEFRKKIILPYFNKEADTVLQTDASKKGFGAVLIQDGNPIYYTSRSLSTHEKNYENLEREAMAAIWGMEKFHYFLYGRRFILQTDQKPLCSIFKKHLINVSPRLQRIAIRAKPYDFTTEWIKGKHNSVADALSRVSPNIIEDSSIQLPILQVNILANSQIELEEREELQTKTVQDAELQALQRVISKGWPQKRSNLPKFLTNYWNYRDELHVEDGILMKNAKILIPKDLQGKYLDKIHQGHQGIQKSLQKAREYIFWDGYTKDIVEKIEKCSTCQESQKTSSTKFRYISDVPPTPWHTLGSDLFYFKKMDFLVVVDYFSKFLIVRKLHNSTSQSVINQLDMIFSEYGTPFIFRSDNGPCYTSQEFKFYMEENRIIHKTSSPHYPQSNGLART